MITLPETNQSLLKMDGWWLEDSFPFGAFWWPIFRGKLAVSFLWMIRCPYDLCCWWPDNFRDIPGSTWGHVFHQKNVWFLVIFPRGQTEPTNPSSLTVAKAYPSLKPTARTWKLVVGRWISFWDGWIFRVMLVLGSDQLWNGLWVYDLPWIIVHSSSSCRKDLFIFLLDFGCRTRWAPTHLSMGFISWEPKGTPSRPPPPRNKALLRNY